MPPTEQPKQRRDGRTEEGRGGGIGVEEGQKQGKKEKPKREKLKTLPLAAESHWRQCMWSRLCGGWVVVVMMMMVIVGYKPHSGLAATARTFFSRLR